MVEKMKIEPFML